MGLHLSRSLRICSRKRTIQSSQPRSEVPRCDVCHRLPQRQCSKLVLIIPECQPTHSKSSLPRPAFLARLSPDGPSSFHLSGGAGRWLPPRVRKSLLPGTDLAQRPPTRIQYSRGCRCSRVRPPGTPVRFWGGTAGTRFAVTWVYPDARQ